MIEIQATWALARGKALALVHEVLAPNIPKSTKRIVIVVDNCGDRYCVEITRMSEERLTSFLKRTDIVRIDKRSKETKKS